MKKNEKKPQYYLLENTEKAQIMQKKISQLLQSKETENLLLALQILEKGGVSDTHLSQLLVFASFMPSQYLYYDEKICEYITPEIIKKSKKLCFKWADSEMKICIKNFFKVENGKESWWKSADSEVENMFLEGKKNKQFQFNTFIEYSYIHFHDYVHEVKKYLVENNIRTDLWQEYMISLSDDGTIKWLHWNDISLRKIPIGIKELAFDGLFIDCDNLEEVPAFMQEVGFYSLAFPTNLKFIEPHIREQWIKYCPTQYAHVYYNVALDLYDKYEKISPEKGQKTKENLYKKATKELKTAVEVFPNFGEAWHWLGVWEKKHTNNMVLACEYFDKAFEGYQYMINNYTLKIHPYTTHQLKYWQASLCALQQKKETAFSLLKEAIKEKPAYKEEILTDNDWNEYRGDFEFQEIIA